MIRKNGVNNMRTLDRILLKLVLVHLVFLIVVQLSFHHVSLFEYTNKLIQYEGVSGIEEQPKQDVFRMKENE
ncbi:DUF5359 family protein [Bacillus niameyensis]|uniref:DUF5359 family protein n=1 Tax=Bacillus niameyensis TaxID=1522308 RepID=UPI0012B5BF5E|nr:DUF5359 family protein [Bacillus niameyensis]